MTDRILCCSSFLMTQLLEWREPRDRILDTLELSGKQFVTELALIGLDLIAKVETLVYSILVIVALAIYPIMNAPYKFFAKLLESSTFTIIWAMQDIYLYNFSSYPLAWDEAEARECTEITIGLPFVREEDQKILRLLPQKENIENGARFLVNHVLKGLSDGDIQSFKDKDFDKPIFEFIVARAISIYAFGDKKSEEIPDFFKNETQTAIKKLRKDIDDIGEQDLFIVSLNSLLSDMDQYKTELTAVDGGIRLFFTALKGAATGDLSGGLLGTECCSKAIKYLSGWSWWS